MNFKKSAIIALMFLAFNLCTLGEVNAASLGVKCLVFNGGSRSKILVRGTGLKGRYYVKVYSGETAIQSGEKATDSKGAIGFVFDSDPDVISANPSATPIPPDFIKNKKAVGVIRKAGTHARIGGVIEMCLPR
ncbi:hypothetical protein MGMO_55c00270 [Methyloglobulus morosus KoM1]|uniref:Uncharacterized protein n=1 Tax=Methyloglobulus morosus KoM1 TaxID=1116472 RepID=V5DYV2_9GAMM|nr:hypothetical protein [Methyloglobulus morosus]ESS72496.1 hypothetical protein MGMO_55c00270 [Methyloglobulus morosus KoM1]